MNMTDPRDLPRTWAEADERVMRGDHIDLAFPHQKAHATTPESAQALEDATTADPNPVTPELIAEDGFDV